MSWAQGELPLELPLVLEEMLASEDAELVALARRIAALPSPDPLCLYCVALSALPLPEFSTLKLCREHLATFRALQCTGWNADRWHQHLAGLARHGRLPEATRRWRDGSKTADGVNGGEDT